jgi:hypothetical protein
VLATLISPVSGTVLALVFLVLWDRVLTRAWQKGGWLTPCSKGEAAARLSGFSLLLTSGVLEGLISWLMMLTSLTIMFLPARTAHRRCPRPLTSPFWNVVVVMIVSVLPTPLAEAGKVLALPKWLTWGVFGTAIVATTVLEVINR